MLCTDHISSAAGDVLIGNHFYLGDHNDDSGGNNTEDDSYGQLVFPHILLGEVIRCFCVLLHPQCLTKPRHDCIARNAFAGGLPDVHIGVAIDAAATK